MFHCSTTLRGFCSSPLLSVTSCVFFAVCQEILQILRQEHWWCTNHLLTIWRGGNSHRKRKIDGDWAFTRFFSHLQLKKLDLNEWSLPKNSEDGGEPKDPTYSAGGFCINHLTSLCRNLVFPSGSFRHHALGLHCQESMPFLMPAEL